MHILQIPDHISEPIPVEGGRPMEAGKKYICTNAFTGQLLSSQWRVTINNHIWALRLLLNAHPFNAEDFDPNKDWFNSHIWLLRGGGFGDLLMLTPLIKEMKKRWPTCHIHVACGEKYHGIFDRDLDVIEELLPVPLDEYMRPLTVIIPFEETIEGTPDGNTMHIADIFADYCDIKLTDRKPVYSIYQEEKEWAWDTYPRTDKKRIGVQMLAGALYRSYPKIMQVINGLVGAGAEVFIFGAPGQITNIPRVTNLMDKKLTFRQSAAVLATCDSCVAPDSSFVHLCSALDLPCIVLYGPIPSSLRISSDKVKAFDGKAPCSPCHFTAEYSTQFPAGMPCTDKGKCVALESIDADEVIQQSLSLG